jgi:predicted RNA-binding protein (virulence factor B family)
MALEGATFSSFQERTCINVIFQDKERLSYTAVRTSKLGQLTTETQSRKTVLFAEIYKLISNGFVTAVGSRTEIMIPTYDENLRMKKKAKRS